MQGGKDLPGSDGIWQNRPDGDQVMFEPTVEPYFYPDSTGYRRTNRVRGSSVTRQRLRKYNWCLEFDIKGLFDYDLDTPLKNASSEISFLNSWSILIVSSVSGKRYTSSFVVLSVGHIY